MIPLAGMIFSNSMNSVSLAAEGLHAEVMRNVPYDQAKMIAYQAAFIPILVYHYPSYGRAIYGKYTSPRRHGSEKKYKTLTRASLR
jgi:hypothetical protein